MLVAVDVGNTSISLGVYKGQRLVKSGRILTGPHTSTRQVTSGLRSLFRRLKVRAGSVENVLMVSVVPKTTTKVKTALKKLCGVAPKVVGKGVKAPIRNLYKRPSQVGQDRLVNAVAARHKYGTPVLVIDFGTAITIDLVSKRGEYAGGVIVPGIEISLETLTQRAALLPKLKLKATHKVLGRDTTHSMQSGVFHGFGSLCDGLIQKLKSEARVGRVTVVATGGQARAISPFLRVVHRVDEHLTLDGLVHIYLQKTP